MDQISRAYLHEALRVAGKATGVSDRVAANTEHIRLTLQRLKQRAETE